jgi:hypothetical protein
MARRSGGATIAAVRPHVACESGVVNLGSISNVAIKKPLLAPRTLREVATEEKAQNGERSSSAAVRTLRPPSTVWDSNGLLRCYRGRP